MATPGRAHSAETATCAGPAPKRARMSQEAAPPSHLARDSSDVSDQHAIATANARIGNRVACLVAIDDEKQQDQLKESRSEYAKHHKSRTIMECASLSLAGGYDKDESKEKRRDGTEELIKSNKVKQESADDRCQPKASHRVDGSYSRKTFQSPRRCESSLKDRSRGLISHHGNDKQLSRQSVGYSTKPILRRWRNSLFNHATWNKHEVLVGATQVVRRGFGTLMATPAWVSAAANDAGGHQQIRLYEKVVYDMLELIEIRKRLESHGKDTARSLTSARKAWRAAATECDSSSQPCPSSGHQDQLVTPALLDEVASALQVAMASAMSVKIEVADGGTGTTKTCGSGGKDDTCDAEGTERVAGIGGDASRLDEETAGGSLPSLSVVDDPATVSRCLAMSFEGILDGTRWEQFLRTFRHSHETLKTRSMVT